MRSPRFWIPLVLLSLVVAVLGFVARGHAGPGETAASPAETALRVHAVNARAGTAPGDANT